MLVTFTTKAYADITMFGDVAIDMLKTMGHSGTVPSALHAEDVTEALRRLKAASANNVPPRHDDEDVDEPFVSKAHRALPLINLLSAAAKDGCDVMWK